MEWFEALFLGAIQGLTEFLPVSSSGHLQLFHSLLGVQGEENLTFAIIVHAATVCSTLVVLNQEIFCLLKGLFQFKKNEETLYVGKILLSMIPVGIVGVFFKHQIESLFSGGILLVGICLMITALLLAFAYYARPRERENISFKDAFIIGIAQACAVLPGISRSGSTIATGILLGDKKEQVAKFSFLMVLIPILGEAFLDLMKGGFSTGGTSLSATTMLIGFLSAFITGMIACRWMINIVKRGKLIWFAIYCFVVGIMVVGSTLF